MKVRPTLHRSGQRMSLLFADTSVADLGPRGIAIRRKGRNALLFCRALSSELGWLVMPIRDEAGEVVRSNDLIAIRPDVVAALRARQTSARAEEQSDATMHGMRGDTVSEAAPEDENHPAVEPDDGPGF